MRRQLVHTVSALVCAVVLLAGCSGGGELTGRPVATSAAAEPTTAVPATTARTAAPTSAGTTRDRPTANVPTPTTSTSSRVGTTALVTASASGTGADGVPTGSARFGQTFRFPSGLEVTVTAPVRFTPSGAAPTAVAHVRVTVTLRNSSSGAIDVGLVGHDATAGGVEAPRFYDPANDVTPPPGGPVELAPGQVRSYRVAFAQQSGGGLVVRTMYGWDGSALHR